MNAEAAATPLLFVVAVVVELLPAKVPLAPLEGAANVTLMLESRFPDESLTVAVRFVANALETVADCPLPAVAVTEVGTGGGGD